MTDSDKSFAGRIRELYPEGLTGVFAIGGTRTSFILEHNRNNPDPGQIVDFSTYANVALDSYLDLIKKFFDLGGQNIIIPILGYQRFSEKGEGYARAMAQLCMWLTEEKCIGFYTREEVDPYFAGIDVLLRLPEAHVGYQLATGLTQFQKQWKFGEGRRKIIWEIAPIPLYSIWQAHEIMGEDAKNELAAAIAETTDLAALDQLTYKYYAQALYGTYIPTPHFYLGSNRNHALKLRTMLPMALYSGVPLRFFYIPYPSLLITRDTLRTILEDVAFSAQPFAKKGDYEGMYTPESAEAEYQRVQALRADPFSTVGLVRHIQTGQSE